MDSGDFPVADGDESVLAGLVYTNAQGEVVFVNRSILNILHYDTPGTIIGMSLEDMLNLDAASRARLFDLGEAVQSERLELDVVDALGQPVRVLCESEPAFDAKKKFMGATLRLDLASVIEQEATPAEAESQLTKYFVAQVDALQVLMGRLAGPNVRVRLEQTFNQTALQSGADLVMTSGLMEFGSGDLQEDVYLTILSEVIAFCANLVGAPVVRRELLITEQQMDEEFLAIVGQAGLRSVIDTLN